MINQKTIQKLQEMRLNAMAESYQQQLSDNDFQNLSFEERLGLIVDFEWSRRKNTPLTLQDDDSPIHKHSQTQKHHYRQWHHQLLKHYP